MKQVLIFSICFLLFKSANSSTQPQVRDTAVCILNMQDSFTLNLAPLISNTTNVTYHIILPSLSGFDTVIGNSMVYASTLSGYFGYDTIRYSVCNTAGCDTATLLLNLAGVLHYSSTPPSYYYRNFPPHSDATICEGLGKELRLNGVRNHTSYLLSHDTTRANITYLNDTCILYHPLLSLMNDTIFTTICDGPPVLLYTCDGFVTTNPCYQNRYVLHFQDTAFTTTFIEHDSVNCGDRIYIGGLGFPTWANASIVKQPRWGAAFIIHTPARFDTLEYYAVQNQPFDTVIVTCAHATQISCDTGIYVFKINCTNDIGTINDAQTNFSIYPNPVNDVLNIEWNKKGEEGIELSIYNLLGARIYAIKTAISTPINTAFLPKGVYLIEAKSKDDSCRKRFVKE